MISQRRSVASLYSCATIPVSVSWSVSQKFSIDSTCFHRRRCCLWAERECRQILSHVHELRVALIFQREYWIRHRPCDRKGRIVPCDAKLGCGIVEFGTLVFDIG